MNELYWKLNKYLSNKSKVTFRLVNHQEYFITGIITKMEYNGILATSEADYLIEIETDKGKMYFFNSEIDSETITLADYNPIRYFIREQISDDLREEIFKRDNNVCQLNLNGCTRIAECLDHIIPVSKGGRTIPDNLQASCVHCNSLKSSNIYY